MSIVWAYKSSKQTITIFIEYNNGERKTYDLSDKVDGWGAKDEHYKLATITDINILSGSAKIGVSVNVTATGKELSTIWGHLDDWSLILEE